MAQAGGIRAGRAFVEIGVRMAALEAGLRKAQARIKAFGAGVSSIGRAFTGLAGVLIAPLVAATTHFIKAGDALEKMSIRTGISVESLSELQYAASQSGADMEVLEKGVRSMQRSINDLERGLSTQTEAFADLGLSLKDLKGLSPEAQFKVLADRISQVRDPSKRAALALQILGRAGTQLLPLMEGGAAGIEELQQQARAMGLTVSGETAKAAVVLGDRLDDLWASVKAGAIAVGGALAPALTELAVRVRENATMAVEWLKRNQATIVSAAELAVKVGLVGVALLAVGKIATGLAATLGLAATAVKGFAAALTFLAAHPVVAVLAVLTAGVVALTVAMNGANREAAEMSQRLSSLRSRGDEVRATDLARLLRLRQLSDQQSLSNVEMEEAERLIRQLGDRYGDLGITLDRTSRSLGGVGDALTRVSAVMSEMAVSQLGAEIAALQREYDELFRSLPGGQGGDEFLNMLMGRGQGDVTAVLERQDEIQRLIRENQARIDRIRGGELGAVGGDAEAVFSGLDAAGIDEAELTMLREVASWTERVHQMKIAAIEDERKRIDARYDHELRRAEGNAALIAQIEQARSLEQAALKRREDSERDEAESQRQAAADQGNADRARTIEELRIRVQGRQQGLDPIDIERQLLDLERQRAENAAAARGESAAAVLEEYRLRRELLDLEEAGASAIDAVRQSVAATFNAAVVGRLGTGSNVAERTAKSTEETARNTREISRHLRESGGGLLFG